MSRLASASVRLVALVVGVLLLAAAGLTIAWHLDVGLVHRWGERVHPPRVGGWPEQQWWPWALAGTATVAVLLALALVSMCRGPRRTPRLPLAPERSEGQAQLTAGSLTVDAEALASASAQVLATVDGVQRATHRVRTHRGVPTLDLTLHTASDVHLGPIAEASARNAEDVEQALPHTRVAQRTFVVVDRVARRR